MFSPAPDLLYLGSLIKFRNKIFSFVVSVFTRLPITPFLLAGHGVVPALRFLVNVDMGCHLELACDICSGARAKSVGSGPGGCDSRNKRSLNGWYSGPVWHNARVVLWMPPADPLLDDPPIGWDSAEQRLGQNERRDRQWITPSRPPPGSMVE